jgi:3-dehydroquinate synthase
VLVDRAFLRTLPRREAVAGMAEAIKVALIRDPALFRWLEDEADALIALDPERLAELTRRSAELHLRHIATGGDPFELGSARPLDFGHWAAHKLETMTGNRLRHVEAVAIGMAIDIRYSSLADLCSREDAGRALALIERLGLPVWDEALDLTRHGELQILRGLEEFREHLGGDLTVTLIAEIGRGVEVHAMDRALLELAIEHLRREEWRDSVPGSSARAPGRGAR